MDELCGFFIIFIETEDASIKCAQEWAENGLDNKLIERTIYKQLKKHGLDYYDETDILDILVVFFGPDFDMVYSPKIADVWPYDLGYDDDEFKVTKKGGAKKRNG